MPKFIKVPLILGVFTLLSSSLLMVSDIFTRDKIAQQKQQLLLRSLKQLIPAKLYNNNLLKSTVKLYEPELLGHRKSTGAYVGRIDGKLSVVAIPVTSRTGYSGDIELMVGIKANGTITAVKILEQHETPGLGDLIEENKSNWLMQFPGKHLRNNSDKKWRVKRDGGNFDQITGATITPRAVVKAVKMALEYFKNHKKEFENIKNVSIIKVEKCT